MTEEKYEPLTKCLCTNTWIRYIKTQGWSTETLYDGIFYDEQFMCDVENWMPTEQVYTFAKNISSRFPLNPNLFFDMALWAARNRTVGIFYAIAGSLIKPGFIYARLPRYISNFNKHRKIDIAQQGKNYMVIDAYHMTEVKAIREACEWTRGLLSAAPIVFNLPAAEVIETLCEIKGDKCCQYEVTWSNRKSLLFPFLQKISGLNNILNDQRVALELSQKKLLERFRDLQKAKLTIENYARDLEIKVEERTHQVRETQKRLLEAEKRSLEHRITGGFSHEMRNALAGAQLELKTTLNYKETGRLTSQVLKDSVTSLLSNIISLHEKYHIPREEIAKLLIPEIKKIADIADHLSETIGGVAKDIDRGLSITNQIREYAKLSILQPGETTIQLIPLLKSYSQRYGQDFERLGIKYSVEGVEGAAIRADEIHLDSIFSNLINNARDALAEHDGKGKDIRVTVERKEDEDRSWLVIKVADNGPGIPKENLNEIFEPFFSTKPSSGTGLGLGIVRRITHLYGGQIEVDSTPGGGSTFTISFPESRNV